MSVMVWTDSNDMKKGNVATGDEGSPMGGAKCAKWAKSQTLEKLAKWSRSNEKIDKSPISFFKLVPLSCTQKIVAKTIL